MCNVVDEAAEERPAVQLDEGVERATHRRATRGATREAY